RNGFREGSNLQLVDRYAAGNVGRLPDLAKEIVAANVDVIIAITDTSVRAVLAVSKATPIVMVVGADPIEAGFVSSLARPGGRVTGITFQTFEGDAKRLQLLREAMPSARRFALLRPPGPVPSRAAELILEAARRLDVELKIHSVDRLDSTAYEAVFADMRREGSRGVVIA